MQGCTTIIVGGYLYKKGELKRVYPASLEETLNACAEVFKSLKIKVKERFLVGIKTKINAEWPDGTPLKVKLVLKDSRITEVSIRSGYVGVLDRDESELIHQRITRRLLNI